MTILMELVIGESLWHLNCLCSFGQLESNGDFPDSALYRIMVKFSV